MKYPLTIFLLFSCSFTSIKCSRIEDNNHGKNNKVVVKTLTQAQQLDFYLKKYSKQYNIPLKYCYNLAFAETRYKGPNHISWKPNHISSCNARGALQILPSTANRIMKRRVNIDSLTNDIELNVIIGMRLLRRCKDKFGSWEKTFSFYNTGCTEVNQYALNIINRK